jgi:hypothetical protein
LYRQKLEESLKIGDQEEKLEAEKDRDHLDLEEVGEEVE